MVCWLKGTTCYSNAMHGDMRYVSIGGKKNGMDIYKHTHHESITWVNWSFRCSKTPYPLPVYSNSVNFTPSHSDSASDDVWRPAGGKLDRTGDDTADNTDDGSTWTPGGTDSSTKSDPFSSTTDGEWVPGAYPPTMVPLGRQRQMIVIHLVKCRQR